MMSNKRVVKVGIADLNIIIAPDLIKTSGLGSCVGVVIYDKRRKIAGLAHIMLPDSQLSKQRQLNIFKFADTAIDHLILLLIQKGASRHSLKSKIAGGAQMFNFNSNSEMMRIGPRNVEAVKQRLQYHSIPLIAEDTGGNCGRTIEFNVETSELFIRTVSKGEQII
ncbi:MAG TPA: chemotaxis protein CheD [Candidatus Avamphibacillus intestinigallinarum]|nr:chemotaxis protein CheD [Candidatus Avamphibacillus intestinigallinarum]